MEADKMDDNLQPKSNVIFNILKCNQFISQKISSDNA